MRAHPWRGRRRAAPSPQEEAAGPGRTKGGVGERVGAAEARLTAMTRDLGRTAYLAIGLLGTSRPFSALHRSLYRRFRGRGILPSGFGCDAVLLTTTGRRTGPRALSMSTPGNTTGFVDCTGRTAVSGKREGASSKPSMRDSNRSRAWTGTLWSSWMAT